MAEDPIKLTLEEGLKASEHLPKFKPGDKVTIVITGQREFEFSF